MKSKWFGNKGNKVRKYIVIRNGKRYVHMNKRTALTQYNAGVRLYKKKKRR